MQRYKYCHNLRSGRSPPSHGPSGVRHCRPQGQDCGGHGAAIVGFRSPPPPPTYTPHPPSSPELGLTLPEWASMDTKVMQQTWRWSDQNAGVQYSGVPTRLHGPPPQPHGPLMVQAGPRSGDRSRRCMTKGTPFARRIPLRYPVERPLPLPEPPPPAQGGIEKGGAPPRRPACAQPLSP